VFLQCKKLSETPHPSYRVTKFEALHEHNAKTISKKGAFTYLAVGVDSM